MANCRIEKNNRHLLEDENAAFITGFLRQICRFLSSTMLCPLVIQRMTFDGFSFSDLSIFSRCSGSPDSLILRPESTVPFSCKIVSCDDQDIGYHESDAHVR